MEYYVYEAEYELDSNSEVRRCDWTKPDMSTIKLHGPFTTLKEADQVAGGRAWAQIDKCYHRVAVITDKRFDPRDSSTHDMCVNPDLYWGRKSDSI